MGTNAEIAAAYFAAAAMGDIAATRALCAPDVQISQNGGPALGFDAMVALAGAIRAIRAIRAAAPDFRYERVVRSETAAGFVEEHDVLGTLADGTAFRIAACVVADVKEGRIASVREYLDTAAARDLVRAMRGPAG